MRFLLGLIVGLILGVGLCLALGALPVAEAQGVGIFERPSCATLTAPVAGQTWCFDSTLRGLKVYTGTAFATVSSVNTYIVNVKDFGAVGDGVTNDAGAIQAAINAVLTGGTVLFPAATYLINTSLTIPITARNLRLSGYGATLQAGAALNAGMLIISDVATANDRAEGIVVEGLTLNGLGSTHANTGQNGLEVYAIITATFRDLRIENIPGIGVKGLKSTQSGSTYWNIVKFDHVAIRHTGQQVMSIGEGGSVVDDVTIINSLLNNGLENDTSASLTSGAVFLNPVVFTILGTEVSANRNKTTGTGRQMALYLKNGTGLISGGNFEDNGSDQSGSYDIFLDDNTNGVMITGVKLSAVSATASRNGIDVHGTGHTIMNVSYSGSASHVMADVVDLGTNALNTLVWGVFNANDPSFPPSTALVHAAAGATGLVPTLDTTTRGLLTLLGAGLQIGTASDKGTGTLNIASASFLNSLPSLVASGTGANVTSVRGLSASQSLSNNLRGACTFAGAATCAVGFTNNEPDAHYFVMTGCNVNVTGKARNGFTMTATGTSSNTCDYILVR